MNSITKKDIAIYGAGGLGRELASLFNHISSWQNRWRFIGFFDDKITKNTPIGHFGNVLGGIDMVNGWENELDLVLCFGSPASIRAIYDKITNIRISFPNMILPDLWISDKSSFTIGQGNIIMGHTEFTTNIHIGNFNLFNGSVVVGHDAYIGDFNVFMPACRVSGEVRIGNECLFGAMSFVHQQLTIPNNVTLSPLSVMLSNPKSNKTYIGNPAKVFRY